MISLYVLDISRARGASTSFEKKHFNFLLVVPVSTFTNYFIIKLMSIITSISNIC